MDSIAKLHLVLILSVVASIIGLGIAVFSESDDSSALTSGDWEYDIINYGGQTCARITSYGGAGGDVTVPATIGGYDVAVVGKGMTTTPITVTYPVISGSQPVTSLTISDGIRVLNDYAFDNCRQIAGDLVIPDSVVYVGAYSFNNFWFVSGGTLTLGNGITHIGESAFGNSWYLSGSLTIPDSVEYIGKNAFVGYGYNDSIGGTLTIGRNVAEIKDFGFSDCRGFTTLIMRTLPALGNYVFHDGNLDTVLNLTGLPNDEVALAVHVAGGPSIYSMDVTDSISGTSMLQQIDGGTHQETVTVKKDGAEFTIMAVIPVFVLLAILLYVAKSMREEDYYGYPVGESDGGADKGTDDNGDDTE